MQLRVAFSPADIRVLDIKPSEDSPLNLFVLRVMELTRIKSWLDFDDYLKKALKTLNLPRKEYSDLEFSLRAGAVVRLDLNDIQKCLWNQNIVFSAEKLQPYPKAEVKSKPKPQPKLKPKTELKSEHESKSKPKPAKTGADKSPISILDTFKKLQWFDQKYMAIGAVGDRNGYTTTTSIRAKIQAIFKEEDDFQFSVGHKTNSPFFTIYFKKRKETSYPKFKAKLEEYCGEKFSDHLDEEFKKAASEPRKKFTAIPVQARFADWLKHWDSDNKKATATLHGAGAKGIKQTLRARLNTILDEDLLKKQDIKVDPEKDELHLVGKKDCSSDHFDKIKQALIKAVEEEPVKKKSEKRKSDEELSSKNAKKAKIISDDELMSSDDEEDKEDSDDSDDDKQMKNAFGGRDSDWCPSPSFKGVKTLFNRDKADASKNKPVLRSKTNKKPVR